MNSHHVPQHHKLLNFVKNSHCHQKEQPCFLAHPKHVFMSKFSPTPSEFSPKTN